VRRANGQGRQRHPKPIPNENLSKIFRQHQGCLTRSRAPHHVLPSPRRASPPRACFPASLLTRVSCVIGDSGGMFSVAPGGASVWSVPGARRFYTGSSRVPRNATPVPPRSRHPVTEIRAAKGRNARLAGRDRQAQTREDDKMLGNAETAAVARQEKRDPSLKYSKRGNVSSQPGQVGKAALKRIKNATQAQAEATVVDEEKLTKKRTSYKKAQGQGIPQQVTDRMLKRITTFSGIPLLFGFRYVCISQILAHCLLPLFECTTAVTFTSTGNCYIHLKCTVLPKLVTVCPYIAIYSTPILKTQD